MSILAGFRFPGVSSSSVPSTTMINIGAGIPSSQTNNAALFVCNFVWEPVSGTWQPMLQPATS